jgi:hypothetical protein
LSLPGTELTAGRMTMRRAGVAAGGVGEGRDNRAGPPRGAQTQEALARRTGGNRATVGRVVRARDGVFHPPYRRELRRHQASSRRLSGGACERPGFRVSEGSVHVAKWMRCAARHCRPSNSRGAAEVPVKASSARAAAYIRVSTTGVVSGMQRQIASARRAEGKCDAPHTLRMIDRLKAFKAGLSAG